MYQQLPEIKWVLGEEICQIVNIELLNVMILTLVLCHAILGNVLEHSFPRIK